MSLLLVDGSCYGDKQSHVLFFNAKFIRNLDPSYTPGAWKIMHGAGRSCLVEWLTVDPLVAVSNKNSESRNQTFDGMVYLYIIQ